MRQIWRLDPNGPRVFHLAATVGSEGIVGGGPGFKVGEVTLVADGDIQRAYFHPMHRLADLRGSHAPARYVATFKFPSGAKLVELAVRLRHATGELSVSGLELRALELRPGLRWFILALQVGWGMTLAAGCLLFVRGVDHRAQRPGSGRGGRYGTAAVDDAGRYAGQHGDPPHRSAAATAPGRRCGGGGRAFHRFSPWPAFGAAEPAREAWLPQVALLIGLAGLSEVLQFLAELRSPALGDWLTNALGALQGWAVGQVWLWWRQDGQFATQCGSSTTVPPQPAKQPL